MLGGGFWHGKSALIEEIQSKESDSCIEILMSPKTSPLNAKVLETAYNWSLISHSLLFESLAELKIFPTKLELDISLHNLCMLQCLKPTFDGELIRDNRNGEVFTNEVYLWTPFGFAFIEACMKY